MSAANVIESFYVALGFKVDPDGVKQVKKQVDDAKESILSIGTAFKAFLATFAIKEVADIGSTFEQNQIQIAGFLSALGQSSDFNAGLQDAQGVIAQITKDAAKLPGEAQEYIEVFKAGYPFVQAAMPGGSLNQITDFTNQLTAIGKTFSLDAGLISREFDHMLSPGRGQASLRLPLFRQLLSFMKKVDGQAHITAESFNAMTPEKRLQVLQKTFVLLKPMLDASANSFDAMWGAAVSALKQLTRIATVPLFKAMKKGLDALTATFYDANGELNEFGRSFSDGAKTIVGWITQIVQVGGAFVDWLIHSHYGMVALKTVAVLVGLAIAGMAIEKTVGTFAKLVKGVGDFKRALMGGLFLALLVIAEDIYTFMQGGDSLTGRLVNDWPNALKIAGGAVGVLTTAFAALKIQAGLAAIGLAVPLAPILLIILSLAALVFGIYEVHKHWSEITGFMGKEWDALYDKITRVRQALGLGGVTNADLAASRQRLDAVTVNPGFQRYSATGDETPAFLRRPGAAYTPAMSPPGTPTAGGGGTTVHETTIREVNIHSNSDQPREVARETAREITRNAQKGYR